MLRFCAVSAAAAIAAFAVPASATQIVVPLGVIVVPPTQTSSPGVVFAPDGDSSGLYEFVISQPNTLTTSSFTNSAVGNTGIFDFTSLALYAGLGTSGSVLQSGTILPRLNGTQTVSLSEYTLGIGSYTIAYSGMVSGSPAGVGSNITFAAGNAVPEPASWAMFVGGFGLLGTALRRRQRTSVRFA